MRTIDLAPLYRTFIGSDQLAQMLNSAHSKDNQKNYPPYNIEAVDEDTYTITLAVAGFSKEELKLEANMDSLVITGSRNEKENESRKYLHRGISNRNFKQLFQLGDHIKVTGADMENGLLIVSLKRFTPEEKKTKVIEIGGNT